MIGEVGVVEPAIKLHVNKVVDIAD